MFNAEDFNKEYEYGDLCGLEYLEKTLIEELKEKNKNTIGYTRYDYLIHLFYAVKELNWCNDIYETTSKGIADNFDYNLYFDTKHLLFSELYKYLEDRKEEK